jgi:hypothetical protein
MSLNFDLTKLSLTSINWGILVHGGIWRLPKLEQDTKETGGSYLEFPTPTTRGYAHASEGQTMHFLKMVKENKMTIEEAQSMLNLKEIKNHRTYKKMFPTPTAREHNELGGSMERHKKLNRENDSLTRAISGMENLSHGGRLNPQWVAWLMGLPIGWINSDYSVME